MIGVLIRRGLRQHWRRAVLVNLALAVSLAFVCGALMVARSVRLAYQQTLSQAASTVDVYVRGPETDVHHGISDFAPLPAALVTAVTHVPGVAVAEGEIARVAQLVSPAGQFLNPGGSTYAYSWVASPRLQAFRLVSGRPPDGPGQVVIDAASARRLGVRVGSMVRVGLDVASPVPAAIVGLAVPRSGASLGQATAVLVDAHWAQTVLRLGGRWDSIVLDAGAGASPEQLRDRVHGVVPADGTSVVTGKQYVAAEVAVLARRTGPITALLIALAALSVIVGLGTAFSVSAIALRQRTQELALLRIAGMLRRQVEIVVLGEAAGIGLATAVGGAAVGIPVAAGLRWLASRSEPLPPVHVTWWVPVATAVVGAVASMLAAALPARRVIGTLPVEAWRSANTPAPWDGRRLALAAAPAAAFAVVAVAGLSVNAPRVHQTLLVAAGIPGGLTVVLILPAAVLALTGRMAASRRSALVVAAAHVANEPARLLVPAAAFAGCVGLVCAMTIVSGSSAATVRSLVQRSERADIVVVSDAAPGIDPEAVEAVREAPAVAAVTEIGTDDFTVDGRQSAFTAIDTDTAAATLALPVAAGSLTGFVDGSIAVTRRAATAAHVRIGDFAAVRFATNQTRHLRVVAVLGDNGITRDWIVPYETYRRGVVDTPIRTLLVRAQPGTTFARLLRQVDVGVNGFPGLTVYSAAAFAAATAHRAEGPIELIDVMAGLAVLIALVGVADALALGVAERRPQLVLLVVLGMTGRKLAATVRWEAAMTAAVGTVGGLAAGIAVGASAATALRAGDHVVLSVPVIRLGVVVVGTCLAALAAAWLPARRAARSASLVVATPQ